MNLIKISWANIKFKPLNTALSIILLAFGVGIISLLLLLEKQVTEKFDRNIKDIDFVLGAKGSPMQLILANVYHVDAPTGNINMEDAKKIVKNPMVKEAIPLAYGDNYEKWRIVGTTFKYPEHYEAELQEGRIFSAAFEVTLGSKVAKETGLKVGDKFTSVHGFDQAAEGGEDVHHHDNPFTVVGILKSNSSALDNLILTPIESVWMVHEGHDHAHSTGSGTAHSTGSGTQENGEMGPSTGSGTGENGESALRQAQGPISDQESGIKNQESGIKNQESVTGAELMRIQAGESLEPKDTREVTAYLIKKRNPMAAMMLANAVKNTNMQLADPAIEMNRLTQGFGIGISAMKAIAIVIMVLSFISVFISLYNSLKERKYELALLRTMGGSKATLFRLILQEGLILVIIGYIIGAILSRLWLVILSNSLEDNFHYELNEMGITSGEIVLLGVTLLVGMVASLLPALRALKMDISKTLSNA
jgi:putative ABC transport system permease protein